MPLKRRLWVGTKNKLIILMIILLFVCVYIYSENENEPSWVLYEKGLKYMNEGEYGEALSVLKMALIQKENENINNGIDYYGYPEVELAFGDIFLNVEPDLAIGHYENAYNLREYFYIPDDKYLVLYRLADLYRTINGQPDYKSMEETYLLILNEDRFYYNDWFLNYKQPFLNTFLNLGLDKLMELYRLEKPGMVKAHTELGWLYYSDTIDKDLKKSIQHYLFSIVLILSEIYEEIIATDLHFKYTTVNDLLIYAIQKDNILAYVNESELYKCIYYLAIVINDSKETSWAKEIYGNDSSLLCTERAKETWDFIINTNKNSEYYVLSIDRKAGY